MTPAGRMSRDAMDVAAASGVSRRLEGVDLAAWLLERSPGIAERWAEGLMSDLRAWSEPNRILVRPFCRCLVWFLPWILRPYRSQLLPLWSECAELYGSVAARRGLSAGEVIEEFQMLREVILRMLFEQPLGPGNPTSPPARESDRGSVLRDALHLNRTIDVGVTQASVGHTDLMVFSLIDGTGAPAPLGARDLDEISQQVSALQREGHMIVTQQVRPHPT